MRWVQNWALAGVTLLVTGCVAVNLGQARRRSLEEAKQQGQYSPAQVMRLAAELCHRVEPESTPLTFVAECDRVPALYRRGHAEWSVRCVLSPRPDGGKAAPDMLCKWDTVTGRLIAVSRQSVPPAAHGRTIGGNEAARRGERWIRALRMIDPEERLQLTQAPARNVYGWFLRFRTERRSGTIRVGLNADVLQGAAIY